jgi:hypothetical protein
MVQFSNSGTLTTPTYASVKHMASKFAITSYSKVCGYSRAQARIQERVLTRLWANGTPTWAPPGPQATAHKASQYSSPSSRPVRTRFKPLTWRTCSIAQSPRPRIHLFLSQLRAPVRNAELRSLRFRCVELPSLRVSISKPASWTLLRHPVAFATTLRASQIQLEVYFSEFFRVTSLPSGKRHFACNRRSTFRFHVRSLLTASGEHLPGLPAMSTRMVRKNLVQNAKCAHCVHCIPQPTKTLRIH